jgi:hypothetical protein
MVFPGESWVSLHGDEAALEALGWSPEGLERAWTFVRDSARTTGLVVVDRGRVVLEFGDVDDLSYVASVRRTKWLDSGMLLMRRATSWSSFMSSASGAKLSPRIGLASTISRAPK